MGCIYTGINTSRSKCGVFKIGQTKDKYPTGRLNANGLTCIYYLSCPSITAVELDLLEAMARYGCQQLGLSQCFDTKDWFNYDIDRRFACKEAQAERFAIAVMARLIQECENMGIHYEVRACYKNNRRYSCAAAPAIKL